MPISLVSLGFDGMSWVGFPVFRRVVVPPLSCLSSVVPGWCSSGPALAGHRYSKEMSDVSRRSRQIREVGFCLGLNHCYWISFATSWVIFIAVIAPCR